MKGVWLFYGSLIDFETASERLNLLLKHCSTWKFVAMHLNQDRKESVIRF